LGLLSLCKEKSLTALCHSKVLEGAMQSILELVKPGLRFSALTSNNDQGLLPTYPNTQTYPNRRVGKLPTYKGKLSDFPLMS